MTLLLWAIVVCGALSIVYGVVTTQGLLKADAGSARMQEISAAVREGASAYLKRQYTTIGIVGVVIFVLAFWLLGAYAAIGFLLGAGERGLVADFSIEEGFRRLHVSPGRSRAEGDKRKRHRGCRLSQSHCIPPRMNEVRYFVFAKGAGKIRPPRRFHAFHHTQRNTAVA